MSALWKLKAWAFNGSDNIPEQLTNAAVPISDADCRTCSNPCEDGHPEFPPRFKVDRERQLLGSVRPFRRQVLISTGKTDWDREITNTSGSLAAHLDRAHQKVTVKPSPHLDTDGQPLPNVPGIFNAADSGEISLLNGSYRTIADDNLETVLVFPDFVVVSGIPSTLDGAQKLWKSALDPRVPRILGSQESTFKTWVLPYSCVITFCSHKRRDNRCAIAAPKLEQAFTTSLHHRGWTVDTQLEHIDDPSLEEFAVSVAEKEARVTETLKTAQTAKKALILYNSHMGGHRFSGNCIIYLPNGASVWYGRVSPHEVDAVVVNTLESGLILPELLRGGVNLSKPGCKTIHDW
ncbi:Sucrase/ferredoxin-like-domain-containing protein [Roridomyces roridus]|uniref:Sucrase/ferredoxin-like-domain-containing protein n=1 Tax=Roridomyces roridus TaxID=1738132 RepID=A0AAD7BZ15_9AGAR|nr:Sucrase/ferredoxin-like-domain-containing protein [Roridomyces roridus]